MGKNRCLLIGFTRHFLLDFKINDYIEYNQGITLESGTATNSINIARLHDTVKHELTWLEPTVTPTNGFKNKN